MGEAGSPHIFTSWLQILSNFLSKDHTFLCLSGSGFPCHWLNWLRHTVCLGLQLQQPVVILYFQGLVISQLKLCTHLLIHASSRGEKKQSLESDLGFHLMENYTCLWPTQRTLWNIWQMQLYPIISIISWTAVKQILALADLSKWLFVKILFARGFCSDVHYTVTGKFYLSIMCMCMYLSGYFLKESIDISLPLFRKR